MDFKSSVEETSEATRSISIEIPREVYDSKFSKLLSQAASNANLKGFRPGRAPRAHVAKLYGEQIHSDVIGDLVNTAYQDVIKEKELKVVGYPEIDIKDEDKKEDLTIVAKVAIYPEPELADYKGLEVEYEAEVFSEDELEKRLQSLCEQQSVIKPLEDRKKAENGDLAEVEYEATVDEVAVPGASGKAVQIELGKEGANSEIGEHVVGMEVGSAKTVEMPLPASFPEELREKPALYAIKLNSLSEKQVPELDDEVAKNSGLAEDVEGLKAHIRENLEKEVAQINKTRKEEALLETIYSKNPFEIPQALIDEEIRMMLFEFGILNPQDRNSYQMDISRFREMFSERGEVNAKKGVILTKLEELEEPEANRDDIEAWLEERAADEGRTRDEINTYYQFPERLDNLEAHVKKIKLIESLLSESKLKEVAAKSDSKK